MRRPPPRAAPQVSRRLAARTPATGTGSASGAFIVASRVAYQAVVSAGRAIHAMAAAMASHAAPRRNRKEVMEWACVIGNNGAVSYPKQGIYRARRREILHRARLGERATSQLLNFLHQRQFLRGFPEHN